jgi:hypothetical protein
VGRTPRGWGISADGSAVQLGEDVRALARLEGEERDRCASLAERLAKLGIEARATTAQADAQGPGLC